ncbi:hypothetical protein L4C31_00350 [Aliivibrio sifiae]
MAYLLHFEFNYTKASIAILMKVSPQQMGNWIKEMDYEVRIHDLSSELSVLSSELSVLKQELIGLGYTPQKALDQRDFL